MAGVDQQDEPGAQPNQADRPIERLLGFVGEQPGLSVTLAYALASLVGLSFGWALFNDFGVPFFRFAELSDFLLAAIREPVTLALVLGAVPVALVLVGLARLERLLYGKLRYKSKVFRWLYRGTTQTSWIFAFFLVCYALIFILIYADWKADRIKAGKGQSVQVRATREAGPIFGKDTVRRLTLLGTTTQYVFLFDPKQQQTHVVPSENIAVIEFTATEDASKQADAKPTEEPEPEQAATTKARDGG